MHFYGSHLQSVCFNDFTATGSFLIYQNGSLYSVCILRFEIKQIFFSTALMHVSVYHLENCFYHFILLSPAAKGLDVLVFIFQDKVYCQS